MSDHARQQLPLPKAATPALRLQRKCSCPSGGSAPCACPEEEQAQRSAFDGRTGSVAVPSLDRSTGQALPGDVQSRMERAFAFDFGRVRVHAGGQAAEAAQSVHARAYTVGNEIVFGAGQYAPRTSHGARLLAHELTRHLVAGGVDRQPAVGVRGERPAALRNRHGVGGAPTRTDGPQPRGGARGARVVRGGRHSGDAFSGHGPIRSRARAVGRILGRRSGIAALHARRQRLHLDGAEGALRIARLRAGERRRANPHARPRRRNRRRDRPLPGRRGRVIR